MTSNDREEGGRVSLHLLDSAQGRVIQTWHFQYHACIRIGRAGDNDISLSDERVSRLHVELQFRDGRWVLRSLGRNGTLIDGALVSETDLPDRTIFQLGSSGPSFRFETSAGAAAGTATIDDFDPASLDFLEIDELRMHEDVQQIVESDAFRELQKQVDSLKRTRDDSEDQT